MLTSNWPTCWSLYKLIYWLISETTTAITGWDDWPTPQPIFKFSLHGTEPIYIPTWRRKAQKNACCTSFPQLSINLNGKTLMMALFMVKHILRWGQWTIFRNLWFGFSRNRILSNVRTQIMNPAKAQTRIAWLLSNMLITMQVLLPNISKDWLYFKTLWVIFKSTNLCSNILKGSWTY